MPKPEELQPPPPPELPLLSELSSFSASDTMIVNTLLAVCELPDAVIVKLYVPVDVGTPAI